MSALARAGVTALLITLVGCAIAVQTPPKPPPPWAERRPVAVRELEARGEWNLDERVLALREVLKNMLTAKGFYAVAAPGPGVLVLDVAYTFTDGTESYINVSYAAAFDSESVDHGQTTVDCRAFRSRSKAVSDWLDCVGRGVVETLVDSPALAKLYADVDGGRRSARVAPGTAAKTAASNPSAASNASAVSGATAAPAVRSAAIPANALIAVLEFRNRLKGPERDQVDAQYFSNMVRSEVKRLHPDLRVMTRENVLVLLKSAGKTLEDCEGECEVDTGRSLGADLLVSGDLLKVGSRLKLDLRLHEMGGGQLLSGTTASGKSVDDLDDALRGAVATMLQSAH